MEKNHIVLILLCQLILGAMDELKLGDPFLLETDVGPVIDEAAVSRFEAAVDEARRTGQVFAGGHRIVDGDLARGS